LWRPGSDYKGQPWPGTTTGTLSGILRGCFDPDRHIIGLCSNRGEETPGGGVFYRLTGWLHLTASCHARSYYTSSGIVRRFAHVAAVGIAISPGEVPLPLG
jgi:hypothetical protein